MSIFELPWNRRIRKLTERLSSAEEAQSRLEADNDELYEANQQLELDLERAQIHVRMSEQSEATLRDIKQKLQNELDDTRLELDLLKQAENGPTQATAAQQQKEKNAKLSTEINDLLQTRARKLEKKHVLTDANAATPSPKRRKSVPHS